GDVVVARADLGAIGQRGGSVVDLVVGHVHLGALRQHIVVAERVHLRLDSARRRTDYEYGGSGISAALAFGARVAGPDRARTDVEPAVHHVRLGFHAVVRRAGDSVVTPAEHLVSRADLARAEIPLGAELNAGVLGIDNAVCCRVRPQALVIVIPEADRDRTASPCRAGGVFLRLRQAYARGIVGDRARGLVRVRRGH